MDEARRRDWGHRCDSESAYLLVRDPILSWACQLSKAQGKAERPAGIHFHTQYTMEASVFGSATGTDTQGPCFSCLTSDMLELEVENQRGFFPQTMGDPVCMRGAVNSG